MRKTTRNKFSVENSEKKNFMRFDQLQKTSDRKLCENI